jgi:hypothetical protein
MTGPHPSRGGRPGPAQTCPPADTAPARTDDWRARLIETVRTLVGRADPAIVEERKWRKPSNPDGVPVWSCDGIICTGETYRDHVKITFAKGAQLDDPDGLCNAGLDGRVRRAINLREGAVLDAGAFVALVRRAVAANRR